MTLTGAVLAVISSSALYVNVGLFFVLGEDGKSFFSNRYLNIFVFGMNLDSVLNDVGMLVACGVLKKFTYEKLAMRFLKTEPIKVEPASQPVFDSREATCI